MSVRKLLQECADSHRENRDHAGALAIETSITVGRSIGLRRFPKYAAAIENAFAYAKQGGLA